MKFDNKSGASRKVSGSHLSTRRFAAAQDEATVPPTYLAVRDGGNFVFGNGAGVADLFDLMAAKGKVNAVFIGDRHHGKQYAPAATYFGAPLCCSPGEAKVVRRKKVLVDQLVPFERHWLHDDLEILPTPGSYIMAFVWRRSSSRYVLSVLGVSYDVHE